MPQDVMQISDKIESIKSKTTALKTGVMIIFDGNAYNLFRNLCFANNHSRDLCIDEESVLCFIKFHCTI